MPCVSNGPHQNKWENVAVQMEVGVHGACGVGGGGKKLVPLALSFLWCSWPIATIGAAVVEWAHQIGSDSCRQAGVGTRAGMGGTAGRWFQG